MKERAVSFRVNVQIMKISYEWLEKEVRENYMYSVLKIQKFSYCDVTKTQRSSRFSLIHVKLFIIIIKRNFFVQTELNMVTILQYSSQGKIIALHFYTK